MPDLGKIVKDLADVAEHLRNERDPLADSVLVAMNYIFNSLKDEEGENDDLYRTASEWESAKGLGKWIPAEKEENDLKSRKSGRPATYNCIAVYGDNREIHVGTVSDMAVLFGYGPASVYRNLRFAEEFGDGIYRPIHAPGWRIWREKVKEDEDA